MERTKVLAVAFAIVSAGAVSILLAGGASAASWHVYEGDIFPGHAYGLQVPADAESLEIALAGDADATASLSLFDPAGVRVGHYALSHELTSARVAGPDAGRYVVYVYDVQGGALDVRVQSGTEPTLQLQKMAMDRTDHKLGSFDQGAVDEIVSVKLDAAPVFATLLYEGSAQDLDATVSSSEGAVVTIADETASAFSPGVWTTMSGARTVTAENIAGTAYTIEVHAAQFEGTMVLTALYVDFAMPAEKEAPAKPPTKLPEKENPLTWETSPEGVFGLPEREAVAFEAKAGTLLLTNPEAYEAAQKDENASEGERYRHGHFRDVVAIYAPDDALLAYVEIDRDEPVAEVELPTDGEYVAYVHRASDDVVLAMLEGATGEVQVRKLKMTEETLEFSESSFFDGRDVAFELERAPVEMQLRFGRDSFGTLSEIQVENDEGIVLETASIAHTFGFQMIAHWQTEPENFRAGEHELRVDGVFEGTLELTSISYVRETLVEPDEETGAEEESSGGESPEAPDAPDAPEAPEAPVAAPGLRAFWSTLFG